MHYTCYTGDLQGYETLICTICRHKQVETINLIELKRAKETIEGLISLIEVSVNEN